VKQFKKNRWFDVETQRDGNYNRSVYLPLEKSDDYKKYYNAYFVNEDEKIQYVLELFRTMKTDKTEIAATLYACAVEIKNERKAVNEKALLEKFYSWSKEKGRFSERLVRETWTWMTEKNIVPNFE
jgi:hypothetical protein